VLVGRSLVAGASVDGLVFFTQQDQAITEELLFISVCRFLPRVIAIKRGSILE